MINAPPPPPPPLFKNTRCPAEINQNNAPAVTPRLTSSSEIAVVSAIGPQAAVSPRQLPPLLELERCSPECAPSSQSHRVTEPSARRLVTDVLRIFVCRTYRYTVITRMHSCVGPTTHTDTVIGISYTNSPTGCQLQCMLLWSRRGLELLRSGGKEECFDYSYCCLVSLFQVSFGCGRWCPASGPPAAVEAEELGMDAHTLL